MCLNIHHSVISCPSAAVHAPVGCRWFCTGRYEPWPRLLQLRAVGGGHRRDDDRCDVHRLSLRRRRHGQSRRRRAEICVTAVRHIEHVCDAARIPSAHRYREIDHQCEYMYGVLPQPWSTGSCQIFSVDMKYAHLYVDSIQMHERQI